jgi:hypothetical protein
VRACWFQTLCFISVLCQAERTGFWRLTDMFALNTVLSIGSVETDVVPSQPCHPVSPGLAKGWSGAHLLMVVVLAGGFWTRKEPSSEYSLSHSSWFLFTWNCCSDCNRSTGSVRHVKNLCTLHPSFLVFTKLWYKIYWDIDTHSGLLVLIFMCVFILCNFFTCVMFSHIHCIIIHPFIAIPTSLPHFLPPFFVLILDTANLFYYSKILP